jgi:hypothetical protein
MHSQVDVQVVPPSDPLVANLPSGRDVFEAEPYQPPRLEEDILSKMRAPPDMIDRRGADDSDSDDDMQVHKDPVGAYPGMKQEYTQANTYY